MPRTEPNAESVGSLFDSDQVAEDASVTSPQKFGGETANANDVFRLPETLLREPLDQKKVVRLSKKEKRLYNVQKTKYEAIQKMNAKRADHPKDTTYSIEDAKKLIEGNFH